MKPTNSQAMQTTPAGSLLREHAAPIATSAAAVRNHSETTTRRRIPTSDVPGFHLAHARIGQVLAGRYRLEAVLGMGAMGEVYRATDLLRRQPCAVKLVCPNASGSLHAHERFPNEAKLVSRLFHPNIVLLREFSTDSDGTHFLVMELLDGQDLHAVLAQQGALSFERTLSIVQQAGAALHYAHELGVVHRDIKPNNIFLSRQKTPDNGVREIVKVLDFGLAKLIEGTPWGAGVATDAAKLTCGIVVGTPGYLAPEMASGALRSADPRSDQWALAVVTYEMLTGRLPFEHPNVYQVCNMICTTAHPSLRQLVPGLPAYVYEAVDRALSKRPQDRFASVSEFVRMLSNQPLLYPGERPDSGLDVLVLAQRAEQPKTVQYSVVELMALTQQARDAEGGDSPKEVGDVPTAPYALPSDSLPPPPPSPARTDAILGLKDDDARTSGLVPQAVSLPPSVSSAAGGNDTIRDGLAALPEQELSVIRNVGALQAAVALDDSMGASKAAVVQDTDILLDAQTVDREASALEHEDGLHDERSPGALGLPGLTLIPEGKTRILPQTHAGAAVSSALSHPQSARPDLGPNVGPVHPAPTMRPSAAALRAQPALPPRGEEAIGEGEAVTLRASMGGGPTFGHADTTLPRLRESAGQIAVRGKSATLGSSARGSRRWVAPAWPWRLMLGTMLSSAVLVMLLMLSIFKLWTYSPEYPGVRQVVASSSSGEALRLSWPRCMLGIETEMACNQRIVPPVVVIPLARSGGPKSPPQPPASPLRERNNRWGNPVAATVRRSPAS